MSIPNEITATEYIHLTGFEKCVLNKLEKIEKMLAESQKVKKIKIESRR